MVTRLRIGLVLLVGLAAVSVLAETRTSGSTAYSQTPSLKDQVRAIEAGTIVEIRQGRKPKKLRGELGAVSDDGFVVHVPDGDEIVARKLAFEEVTSIQPVDTASPQNASLMRRFVRGLAAVGYVFTLIAEP